MRDRFSALLYSTYNTRGGEGSGTNDKLERERMMAFRKVSTSVANHHQRTSRAPRIWQFIGGGGEAEAVAEARRVAEGRVEGILYLQSRHVLARVGPGGTAAAGVPAL